MVRVFRFFERVMGDCIIYWQFARQHYAREATFPIVTWDALESTVDAVLSEVDRHVPRTPPIALPGTTKLQDDSFI